MNKIKKKVCLLGDFSVGKTSLVRQFVEGVFNEDYLSTIGVKISRKNLVLSDKDTELSLFVWDLAGGDDYSKVTSGYLAGVSGLLMVCDVTRKSTLGMLEIYSRQLKKLNISHTPAVILINKIDLHQERELKDEDIELLSQQLNAPWQFTSAKTGEGVQEGIEELANLLI